MPMPISVLGANLHGAVAVVAVDISHLSPVGPIMLHLFLVLGGGVTFDSCRTSLYNMAHTGSLLRSEELVLHEHQRPAKKVLPWP